MYWFSNWCNGWTEINFSAAGTITAEQTEKRTVTVHVTSPITIAAPEKAAIRYKDTLLEHDRALTQIANRWDRIQAVCGWLSLNGIGYEDAAAALPGIQRKKNKDNKKKYPPVPENFLEILETGTLKRDWMEGAPLFKFALDLPVTDETVSQMKWRKEK